MRSDTYILGFRPLHCGVRVVLWRPPYSLYYSRHTTCSAVVVQHVPRPSYNHQHTLSGKVIRQNHRRK